MAAPTKLVVKIECNEKLSHRKYKALIKKEKRRLKRQLDAKQRDEEERQVHEGIEDSPFFQDALAEQQRQEDLLHQREAYMREQGHELWLEREQRAQLEFEYKKRVEAKKQQERIELEKQIKKELEEQERVEQEKREAAERLEKEKKEKQEKLLAQVSTSHDTKNNDWHNPLAPANYGQERALSDCPFFVKTGACRFGDRCSRAHARLANSHTLLIPGMFSHASMSSKDDGDASLEYEDIETYRDFVDFYRDVLPEFKLLGKVVQFKVCCNYEPHLRGNVYVQYASETDAQAAFAKFNGRWYAGRQLSCEFSAVTQWKAAICGLFHWGKCPKGRSCNFIHAFRNPSNEFLDADRGYTESSTPGGRHRSSTQRAERRGGWDCGTSYRRSRSPSPRSAGRGRSRSHDRRRRRSRSRSRRRHRKRSRSSSASRDRRSRSRSADRGKPSKSSPVVRDDRSRSRSRPKRGKRSRSRHRDDSKSGSPEDGHRRLQSASMDGGGGSRSKKHRSRSKKHRSRSRSGSAMSDDRSRSKRRKRSGRHKSSSRRRREKHKASAARDAEVTGVVEVTEVTGVAEVMEVTGVAEVTEVTGVAEVMEVTGVADVTEVTEVTGDAEVMEVTGVADVTEVTEVTGVAEVTGDAEVMEVTGVADVTEVTEVTEVTGDEEATEGRLTSNHAGKEEGAGIIMKHAVTDNMRKGGSKDREGPGGWSKPKLGEREELGEMEENGRREEMGNREDIKKNDEIG